MVVGDDPGPVKMEKAKNYGIPTISEDEFLDMIRIKSGMTPLYSKEGECSSKIETSSEGHKTPEKGRKISPKYRGNHKSETEVNKKSPSKENVRSSQISTSSTIERSRDHATKASTSGKKGTDLRQHTKIVHSQDLPQIERPNNKPSEENISWTEKYKPKDLKSIIGQQGDKSNMNKLLNWLKNWHKYHGGKERTKVARPTQWAKDDNGAYYKCALLSGPPGVGKY